MTADEYAHHIAAEARAHGDERRRRAIGYLEQTAMARVKGAGLEYQESDAVQGFELRSPVDLVREVEDELADALAWSVAFRLRMEDMGCEVNIQRFIGTLGDAMQEIISSSWWSDARDAQGAAG